MIIQYKLQNDKKERKVKSKSTTNARLWYISIAEIILWQD
jgi:hypothetical protein